MDVSIKIKDREGVVHEVQAPTDMNMNIMEPVRAYELAQKEPLEFVEEWLCVHLVNVIFQMI